MEHSNSEDWASTAWHTKASASSSLIPCSGLVTAGRLLGWHNQSGYPNRGMSLAPGGQPWLLNHDYTPAVSRSQAELRFTRQRDFGISPIAMPLAVNVGLDHQPGAAAVAGLC